MGKNKERKRILVARFSALGDVAMTLPSVYNACYANPDAEFYFLTRHHPAQVFINRPDNLTVVGVNLDNYKGLGGIIRLAKSLMKRYELTDFMDLHDVLRTKMLRLILKMQGVRVSRLHKGRRQKRELTRRNNKVLVQLKSTPQRYEGVFRRGGIALANDFQSLYGDAKGDPKEFAEVSAPKRQGEWWLAVAPFAKHPGKVYPMEQLERVIEHFNARQGARIFVFGFGQKEEAEIETLAKRYPSVVNMAKANIGIGPELSLLSHCDVMLSMDSANMHLASLVGLRTVSVWGATHPYTGFLGWKQRTRDVVQLDMTCRPCSVFGDRPCFRGDYHCLHGIPPQMIIQRIENPG